MTFHQCNNDKCRKKQKIVYNEALLLALNKRQQCKRTRRHIAAFARPSYPSISPVYYPPHAIQTSLPYRTALPLFPIELPFL